MKPSVSVVITTYNQAPYIAETVLSALNQTYPHLEVIVVDDGSTDETGARLAPFRDRVALVRQENQGVAASRNTGVRAAKGELIAFLDGDDLWEPDKLDVQVAAYQAHPGSGLIAVDACVFSGAEVLTKSTLPWSTTLSAGDGAVSTGRFHDDLLRDQLICTTSQVMIPARVLKAVGLEQRADHHPNQLSGGQQQRVAIARSLINNPSILLADEPTGNLDTRTSIEVMDIFQRLNKERGITVLLITHEQDIAEYGTRIVQFRDGQVIADRPVTTRREAQHELAALPEAAVV